MKYNTLIIAIIVIIALFAIVLIVNTPDKSNIKTSEEDTMIQVNNNEVKITEDGTKYIVDPDKIRSGGPPKGGIGVDVGIPAIINPKFVSVSEADKWIEDNELVLAIQYKNIKRVYPLQILVFHEIVNDFIADDPILITYCPLCGSGIAYERTIEIDGEKVEANFGTSGKLFNSNLVMYDSLTDTYWQQIDGLAIVGELTGHELKEISIDTVSWGPWKSAHSDSEVLSQDTGFNRNYGKDPYGNYYEDSFLIFPVENQDERIHAKTVVFGIEVNGVFKAYRESDLIEQETITDTVAGINIKLERSPDGTVKVTNLDNGKEIVKERDFWFAWFAFHPETELYGF